MADASEDRKHARQQQARSQRDLQLVFRRLSLLFLALGVLIIAGTVAFAVAEKVSIWYGFVWTLDTVTTLGSIRQPRGTPGEIVVVGLELLGIGTLFYALATMAEFFVSGQLSGLREERRGQKMIDSQSDHYIICAYGRVGRQVVRDLTKAGASFVVIDDYPTNREPALAAGIPFIFGDPADDEVLKRAGIERACGVIACVDSDAENIFIALSVREIRSDILIIARASAEESEKKLLRAGADRVISPYKTSGAEMARIALHPQVGSAVGGIDYRMEEIEVPQACEGVGRTVDEVRGGAMIVALRRADGRLEPQPPAPTIVNPGDILVALGTPDSLDRLESLFQPASVART
jgi:voltage-gated potassium channel